MYKEQLNPEDKISKSSWALLQIIKDTISANLTTLASSKQVAIDLNELQKLLTVISTSADEGYHRGHKNFMRTVAAAVSEQQQRSADVSPEVKGKKK